MSSAAQRIERLRTYRGSRPRELSIQADVERTKANAVRTSRTLGELAALWESRVPRELANHTKLAEYRGGVLQVRCDSSAAVFELDRLLRGGLMHDLRREFRGTLVRIKTRLG